MPAHAKYFVKEDFRAPAWTWRNVVAGTKRAIPSGQYRSIMPAWVANCNTGFGSSCPLAEQHPGKLSLVSIFHVISSSRPDSPAQGTQGWHNSKIFPHNNSATLPSLMHDICLFIIYVLILLVFRQRKTHYKQSLKIYINKITLGL